MAITSNDCLNITEAAHCFSTQTTNIPPAAHQAQVSNRKCACSIPQISCQPTMFSVRSFPLMNPERDGVSCLNNNIKNNLEDDGSVKIPLDLSKKGITPLIFNISNNHHHNNNNNELPLDFSFRSNNNAQTDNSFSCDMGNFVEPPTIASHAAAAANIADISTNTLDDTILDQSDENLLDYEPSIFRSSSSSQRSLSAEDDGIIKSNMTEVIVDTMPLFQNNADDVATTKLTEIAMDENNPAELSPDTLNHKNEASVILAKLPLLNVVVNISNGLRKSTVVQKNGTRTPMYLETIKFATPDRERSNVRIAFFNIQSIQ